MRRRGVVTGAALLLVVLFLLVGAAMQRDDDPATQSAEPLSADAFYALDGPPTCDSEVREVPGLPLEAEPVAMLLCAAPDSSQPWIAPPDLVEGDLTALVQALSDLEPVPEEAPACHMVGGPAYDLVLTFSRGRVARIHGDTGGCGVVTVASGEWFGATEVLDTALRLVARQRSAGAPAAGLAPVDLSCGGVLSERGPLLSITGEVGDVVAMVSCWQPNAAELGPWTEATVPTRDVRSLARDAARTATPYGDSRDLRCPGGLRRHYFQHLLGATAWGDVVMLAGECRRFLSIEPRPDGPVSVWHPSPRSQRILDRLRAGG